MGDNTAPPLRDLTEAERAFEKQLVEDMGPLKANRDAAVKQVRDLREQLAAAEETETAAIAALKAHRGKFVVLRS
ncbi:hypothetical protein E4T38_09242 [Aureobasidium subglaciale]|nr:hypothetical protein E4T38_09242 [Aureobasidium subglaciale]KAI5214225.1 hypothetical protein E4T40_09156 [Aureobasidium subglaciale]KAI5216736.1 hypothetical protein E4T41_09157 [Aureobasidium subglaciale]KAI5254494.1 hypothetical protein E4T46_09149 [Aureobasidium subglaciale]